ncbi:uncharacterized protein B0H64DRAFT_143713 [Chaetomium fimeti]|uniref:NB-ARC domain-containing protein n=1 Tax=Chaetomium fimeti TaxID=1854472 RepID=A0AAE0HF70_9PEZI|nr:hypothetical protein B0H64DRAFT_143713 [Chaetomium fimeti]
MGGIGKTQIANQYVHQLRAPYLVYFIHCETPVSILESYRRCLREPSGLDPELVVERFAQQVRELDKLWLIIFDNVGDADAFAKFGPDALQLGEGRGSFLLTTRYPPSRLSIAKHKVQRFKAVEVGLMDTDEAKELLLHALDPDEVDSSELSAMIDRAGGFPLALSMLPTLLRGKTTPTTSPGAEGLWKYQIPPPSSSLANEYLFGLACLDVTGIPIDILVEYERCASLAMGAKEALYLLVGSHVIRYAGGGQIMMDQLVRDTGLTQLRSQDRLELIARLAMDAVANLYQRRKILPDPYATQVEALMELESASPYRSLETNLAKGRLFLAKGTFFLSQGLPAAAEGPLRRSLDVYSGLAGYEDRDMLAMVVPALATAYLAQGRDAEAEQLEARYQTRVADAEQYNAHSDNETEDQEADDVEIESVISNLPSLTAGSTISSALSLALIEDIKADVLSILTKDEGFHGLFQETPKRITHDKFQRNFLRLFRSFLSDIRKQSDDGEQELRQVIRILRYQSRNIASHICQQIFDLKAQSDALLSLARQVPDKGGQLTSFFGDESAPELASALKEQPFDEGDSSGGESEEPEAVRSHPVPLGDLEIIILESNSFLTFRERYRTFLFPRSDPQPLEADIPTENKHPTVEMDRSDPSIEPTSEPIIRPSLLQEGFAFVKAGVQRLIRPPIKEGYIRLEWRCDCGDSLYADFAESDADSIRQLEASLKGHAPHAGGGTAPSQPNHPPGGASAPTPAPGPPPSQPPYNTQSNNTGQTPGQNQPPVAAGGVTHTSGPASQAKKRFIELCINTGEFQRQLAEIDISTVASDAQLFERIRERYREVRSFRVKYFLLKPVDVHFVQFSVEDRHRVGILDKPMAIPTVAEMAAEGYAYHPCPLRPPPIPANIFLHHLSKPGQHPKLLWGNRIPQKLHKSILQIQTPDDLVTGWGVHIIEGLNMTTVLLCSLAGLLVSMIVAVVWAVVKGDVQGAFGIGAWVTSVEAILVMLVVTKWLET